MTAMPLGDDELPLYPTRRPHVSHLDQARAILGPGPYGPAVIALVLADLATGEYGDPDLATEDLASNLDLLGLEVIPGVGTLAEVAEDLVVFTRTLERGAAEASPTELGRLRVVEHQLDGVLAALVRRHP